MSKNHSEYILSFDYFDKSFIVLSTTSDGISIASFFTVTVAPAGIATPSFSFEFLITTSFKKLFKGHEIKRKSIIKLLC